MNVIKTFLDGLNVGWSDFGNGFSIEVDDENRKGMWEDVKDDDVVIGYDFMSDDVSDDSRIEKFKEWLFGDEYFGVLGDDLQVFMKNMGYVKVYDYDGSGDGLCYGCEIFRKS